MSRSGFASLLALIVLAVATTLVAGMLSTARNTAVTAMVAERQMVSDTLLADGERLACSWLDHHAQHIVLPPAGGGLLIFDHEWNDAGTRSCRLAIVIHDAYASLPVAALAAGHPLRMALASPGSALVLHSDPESVPTADLLAQLGPKPGWATLPTSIPRGRPIGSSIDWPSISPQPVIPIWFNPDNHGAVNANTAPAAILRTAAPPSLNAEDILAGRRAGRAWKGPAMTGVSNVQIVGSSSRWNILLVAEIGSHRTTRWAVGDGVGGRITIIRRHDVVPASPPALAP